MTVNAHLVRALAALGLAAVLAAPGAPALAASNTPARPDGRGKQQSSLAFFSDKPGSGNHVQWHLTLPTDPPPQVVPGRTWSFQLQSAFEVTMALCDTQSYPEQVTTCTPDSDTNITALSNHPGTALLRLQFYAPGWVPWPAGSSCDPTRWCTAMVIDSLAQDPIHGTVLNPTCQAQLASGSDVQNFAFLTKSGVAQAPANPVDATVGTFIPDPNQDLLMQPGDRLQVTLVDTAHGVQATVADQTSGQSGTMTASAANSFGQVRFDPSGTSCTNVPYDFHPMYSTAAMQARVPWAAQSFNIGFTEEIGPWDACTGPTGFTAGDACPPTDAEGDAHASSNTQPDLEPADADDTSCFPAPSSTLVQVSGCVDTNLGFDGVPYHFSWPDGNTQLHPTTVRFSSPRTGATFDARYDQAAFETNLPVFESIAGVCNAASGQGCSLPAMTDDGRPVDFYPFFSLNRNDGSCHWGFGSYIQGFTDSDFGGLYQYGLPLAQDYVQVGGTTASRVTVFRQVLAHLPC